MKSELVELLELLDEQATHLHRPLGIGLEAPLMVHATYSRDEALAAMGLGTSAKPPTLREGVKRVPDENADIFLFTLRKSDADFSPTTRYNDYAISPELFHWESQSTTSEASPTTCRSDSKSTRVMSPSRVEGWSSTTTMRLTDKVIGKNPVLIPAIEAKCSCKPA